MKRNKLLIPTLSALAITPAIALFSCNQTSVEQEILDCITKPLSLEATPVDSFEVSYKGMTDAEKQSELIYDAFGMFDIANIDNGTKSITSLWSKDNEGGFKVNIQECNIVEKDEEYLASLRGYISYVFSNEHTYTPAENVDLTMKANDYVMITFEFINRPIIVDDFYFRCEPEEMIACLGFQKIKYESSQKDMLIPINGIDTHAYSPKNSKNWVQKS